MRTAALGLLLAAALAAAEDVLVAHPSVPVDALDQAGLRDVFLGRRTTWPNGQHIVIVLQRDGPAHERLARELGRTPQQLVNWWKRQVFTGEGKMPEQVDGGEALIVRVAAIPGAIGWIEKPVEPPSDKVKLVAHR